MLLKELVETVTATSHTIEYDGQSFIYAEIDSMITTVARDNQFTAEFAQEITDAYPSLSGISHSTAIVLIGQSNLDATLVAVAPKVRRANARCPEIAVCSLRLL